MKRSPLLLLICMCCYVGTAIAQVSKSPFKAGAWVGLNMSQVDGDEQYGYDRPGIAGGLRGGVALNRYWEVATELLYSERGSAPAGKNLPMGMNIDLAYAEVPIMLRYHYYPDTKLRNRWDVYAGVSYSRMLRSRTRAFEKYVVEDKFITAPLFEKGYRRDEFSFICGLSAYLYRNLGVTFRYNYSFNKFYSTTIDSDYYLFNYERIPIEYLRNYWVTFGVFYEFNTPYVQKTKKKRGSTRK
jgi:Outer membrane protein beta-barrel domain